MSPTTPSELNIQLVQLTPQHAESLVEAVLEIANDPHGHNLWWVHKQYSLVDAHAFIARSVVLAEQKLGRVFVIENNGQLLGLANAKAYDWVHGCFQGGYWLRPWARGHGAATKALRLLALQERERGMLRMELLIGHDNNRSQAVAMRVGARYEGRLAGRLLVNDVRKDAALLAVWLADVRADEEAPAVRPETDAQACTRPSVESAHQMGARGAPHSEAERQLFEAYMKGHCWKVGDWIPDKQTYADMSTRVLFAVWRDRAALGSNAATSSTPQ
jgi:RimJ/RimL family protein N-acetyltransferase